MKTLVYLLNISIVLMLFTSCFKELDNWYTNTSKYDGRYVVAQTCDEFDDFDTAIQDGYELWIYNSAANVEDEIIIETHVGLNEEETPFSIKGKFKINENISHFSGIGIVQNLSASTEFNLDDNGEFWIFDDFLGYNWYPSDLEDLYNGDYEDYGIFPQEEYEAIQMYTRLSMEEGKITPDGATTIGGNKSDGVNMKITLYHDYLVVERYETPKETWADPNEPVFGWRIKAGSRQNADDEEEHWTLKGYRYTGFPEDDPNIQPPIVEK